MRCAAGNGGDQLAGVIAPRHGEQLGGGTVFYPFTAVQYRNAVRNPPHRRQIVRNKQVGQVPFLLQLLQQMQDLRLHRDVERRRGLIQYQYSRLQHQRAGNRHPLTLAAGQFVRPAVQQIGRQRDPFEQLTHPPIALWFADRREIQQRFFNHPIKSLFGIERAERILINQLNALPKLTQRFAPETDNIDAVDQDLPGIRPLEAQQATRQRAFARPGLSHQRMGGAARHAE